MLLDGATRIGSGGRAHQVLDGHDFIVFPLRFRRSDHSLICEEETDWEEHAIDVLYDYDIYEESDSRRHILHSSHDDPELDGPVPLGRLASHLTRVYGLSPDGWLPF